MAENKLWVPLHLHTEYSALDGAIKVPDYYRYAMTYGLPGAAITDHFTMSGFSEVGKVFREVKPIYGCELYAKSLVNKNGEIFARTENGKRKRLHFHLNCWATSQEGYRNLLRLVSAGYESDNEESKGPYNVSIEDIEKYRKGLVFSSACLGGELQHLLGVGKDAKPDLDTAAAWVDRVKSALGGSMDNFYLEIMDLGDANKEQIDMNEKLQHFSELYGIKTILTTDSHYMKEDAGWYDALLASQYKQKVADREKMVSDLSLRTPDEIWERNGSKYADAIEETVRFAERVEKFEIGGGKGYKMPKGELDSNGFHDRVKNGLKLRLEEYPEMKPEEKDKYFSRLEYEYDVIAGMGFTDYFLMIEDVIKYAKNCASPIQVGPGRGSAAGSLIAFSLGITQLDPMKYGLLFERFLNKDRVSMPDIDIDFEDERRGDIIAYLKSKYGQGSVTPIANYSRSQWKTALKDAARVLGAQPWQCDYITKSAEGVSEDPNTTIETIREHFKNVTVNGMDRAKLDEIIDLSSHFKGIVRQYGKHASGIIIAPGRTDQFAPVGRVKNSVCCQFDMDGVDFARLIKVDILGLSTLSMIREMQERTAELDAELGTKSPKPEHFWKYINLHGNAPNYETELDKNDDLKKYGLTHESVKRTYQLLNNGDTTGVFQMSGRGMRKLTQQIAPKSMEDLSACIALFRPGPLNSGIADMYKNYKDPKSNKKGSVPESKFPEATAGLIKSVCERSRGVPIYQEDIMNVARHVAGYTLGEADILRKAMGKKKIEVMHQQREQFKAGAARTNNISETDADKTFDTIEYFAGYGFNKSHSLCYSAIAFMTAWYKANREPVFWAALVNDTMKKQSKTFEGTTTVEPILTEIKTRGYETLPPSFGDTIEKTYCGKKDPDANDGETRRLEKGHGNTNIWTNPKRWEIFLGADTIKRYGSKARILDEMKVSESDTFGTMLERCIERKESKLFSAILPLFQIGYFDDSILASTARKFGYVIRETDNDVTRPSLTCFSLRVALYLIAHRNEMSEPVVAEMNRIYLSIKNGRKRNEGSLAMDFDCDLNSSYAFPITKSRSVVGSFLDGICTVLTKKMQMKRQPWTMEDVKAILKRDFISFEKSYVELASHVQSDIDKAQRAIGEEIDDEIKEAREKVLYYKALMYCSDIETFGTPLNVKAKSVIAGYASVNGRKVPHFITDPPMNHIKPNKTVSDLGIDLFKAQNILSCRSRYSEEKVAIAERAVDDMEKKGVYIAGRFLRYFWKGTDGYLLLGADDGATGKEQTLFVSVNEPLPIQSIEEVKKINAAGGWVVVKACLDNSFKDRWYLADGINDTEEHLTAGLKGLKDNFMVLPMKNMAEILMERAREKEVFEFNSEGD